MHQLPETEARRREIFRRTRRCVTHDRFGDFVQVAREYHSGCGIDTTLTIYHYFFPEQNIPRHLIPIWPRLGVTRNEFPEMVSRFLEEVAKIHPDSPGFFIAQRRNFVQKPVSCEQAIRAEFAQMLKDENRSRALAIGLYGPNHHGHIMALTVKNKNAFVEQYRKYKEKGYAPIVIYILARN